MLTHGPGPHAVPQLIAGLAMWIVVGIVPGSGQYITWDDTDPTNTGCSAPQQLHPPGDRFAATLPAGAMIALRYSLGCRTVWAELNNGQPITTTAAVVRSDGRQERCTADAKGYCRTLQLDDADVTSCAEAHDGPAATRTGCT